MVRANQGHTFKLNEEELFTRIQSPEELNACIHGTYSKFLPSILKSGLSIMKRTHVHFTPSAVVTSEARSGFRGTCDILIHLDVRRALAEGLKLFRSENNVILCPGDASGFISPKYFEKVESRWTGEVLFTNKTCAKPAAQSAPMEIDRQLPPKAVNITYSPREQSNPSKPQIPSQRQQQQQRTQPHTRAPVVQRGQQNNSQSFQQIQQADMQQASKQSQAEERKQQKKSYADHLKKN